MVTDSSDGGVLLKVPPGTPGYDSLRRAAETAPDLIVESPSGILVVFVSHKTGRPSERHGAGWTPDVVTELERLWRQSSVHADGEARNVLVAGEADADDGPPVGDLEATHQRSADLIRQALDALVPTLAELDPVPHGTIEQAKRRAVLRTNLLASGAYTYGALAEGRQQSLATVRQWVHRARRRQILFTVKHDNESLVPAFLLDEDLEPRPQYAGAIEALTAVGEDGWALWAWFALPSGWLDGEVPASFALVDGDAVTHAARRRASNAA